MKNGIKVKVYEGPRRFKKLKLVKVTPSIGRLNYEYNELKENIKELSETLQNESFSHECSTNIKGKINITSIRSELIKLSHDTELIYEQICGYGIEKWCHIPDDDGGQKEYFWALKGTINEEIRGAKYVSLNMSIPTIFFDKLNKNSNKYKFEKYPFLLRPADNYFLKNPSGDHGQHGCPTPPLGGNGSGGGKKDKRGVNKYIPAYFKFNSNYYFPMIMPNFHVCFYVTESKKRWIDKYDPDEKNVSADFPIQYDTTLGIFYTREVSFVEKD